MNITLFLCLFDLAALFFTTSLGLAVLNSQKGLVHDLMSTPSAGQETASIHGDEKTVDSVPSVPSVPPVSTAPNTAEQAPVSATPPVGTPEIKDTVVPKKAVVEEKTATDKSKNPVKGK